MLWVTLCFNVAVRILGRDLIERLFNFLDPFWAMNDRDLGAREPDFGAIGNPALLRELPPYLGRVEHGPFDTRAFVIPMAVLIEHFGNARKADPDAACHRCFQ